MITKRRTSAALAALLAATLAGCATMPGAGGAKGAQADVSSIEMADPAAMGFDAAKLDDIRTALNADVASGKIPGAYLVIGRHGKVVFNEGFGVQGPGQSRSMGDDTIFRVFSMTKPIVTVTAMTLVEEGKLSVDDPVSKYLPEFANMQVMQKDGTLTPATQPMLIRHLMSHTSGLIYSFIQPNAPISKVWVEGGEMRTDLPAKDWAREVVAKLPLVAEPGTAWNYSHSTDVLGAVIEVATGQSLDVAVKERVTGPLGMTDTDFFQPTSKSDRFAQSKDAGASISGASMYYDYTKATPYMQGGGGLSSTPEDYLRFVLMLENDGEYRGVRILKPETLARMRQDETTPQIRKNGLFFPGPGMGFGLGFSLVLDDTVAPPKPGTGTFSWNGIAGTEFWVDPKNDVIMEFFIQDRALLGEYQRKNRKWIYDALVQ
ncbi:MAG: serine hydrolase domain-containing protein [Hyphomonadaceae bacterium]